MFFWNPFGGLFGFLVPIFFLFIGIRILRHFLGGRGSRRTYFEDYHRISLPPDDLSAQSHYKEHTESPSGESIQSTLFKLADEMKGRLTVSDIVIGTNLGLKEAEEAIDELVDGIHVTIEVSDSGRVIYEFPEIIAKYENHDEEE